MAEKRLTVDEDGNVSEEQARVKSGDKVVWERAAGLKGEIAIEFPGAPFKDSKWIKKEQGKKVFGTVKSEGDGTYYYTATYVPSRRKAKVTRSGKRAQPQIIVDGRRTRKTAATRSTAAKSAARKR